jgi:hypothetical protein
MPGAPHDPPLTPLPALPLPPGVPLWPTLPPPAEPLPEPEPRPLPVPEVAPELVPESRKSVPAVLEPPQEPVTRANAIHPASRITFHSFVLRGAPSVPRAGIVFKKDLALLQREARGRSPTWTHARALHQKSRRNETAESDAPRTASSRRCARRRAHCAHKRSLKKSTKGGITRELQTIAKVLIYSRNYDRKEH